MRRRVLALGALLVALAGCGTATQIREPDLVAEGSPRPAATVAPQGRAPEDRGVSLAVVTHGQASDPFWVIVRNGVEAAARQTDASVTYRSPDTYSVGRMRSLIEEAVAARPDGLVVSIPSPALEPVIRRAISAGVPVVSLNSGSDVFRKLGVLAHVGQPEERAGEAAGRRMAEDGIRRALCVDHEQGNQGLTRRCRGFARALRAAGGSSRVIGVETENRLGTRRRLVAAMDGGDVDGVLTLSAGAAVAALEAIDTARRVRQTKLGSFDLSPEVLEALEGGRLLFAVDQQAYLQGYLPVLLLAQRARYGLFPAQGEVVPTGPSFVTKQNAAQALRLSRRGIR